MSRHRALWIIYGSVAISYLGVGIVAPLISLVLSQHGVGRFTVGLVGTTMFTFFTLSSFPVGAVADRIGPKPVLVIGLVLYGFAILTLSTIETTGLFFVVRSIEGVGAAAISVATETLISQLSEPLERARRMSYYGLSVGIGWALGPLFGTSLFSLHYAAPFIACWAFSMLAAITVGGFVPKTRPEDHHVKGVLKGISLNIAIPLSAGALYGYLMSSLVTLFPLYLKNLGVADVQMGGIVTAVIFGTVASQVPIGRAADRYGKRVVLLTSAVALTILFSLMPLHSRWALFLVFGVFVGALAGSLYPIGLAMLGSLVRHNRLGAATALFSLTFGIGSLTGPSLSGLAMSRLGDSWLFYLPATLTGAFAIELMLLYSRTGEAMHTPSEKARSLRIDSGA